MEGVRSLIVDLDPEGLTEQEALDCFFKTPNFTIVTKGLKNWHEKGFRKKSKSSKSENFLGEEKWDFYTSGFQN